MQLLTAFFTAGTVITALAEETTSALWFSITSLAISSAATPPIDGVSPEASMTHSVMALSLKVSVS